MQSTDKVTRILMLYQQLLQGNIVNKTAFTVENQITERTFERDIDDIRLFLSDSYATTELVYDKFIDGYKFTGCQKKTFTEFEFLVISKVLFASKALRKDEMIGTVNALQSELPKHSQERVKHLLDNEIFHYQSPSHDKAIIKMCWDLVQSMLRKVQIELIYEKQDKKLIERTIFPESVIFFDYYFYLIAYLPEEYRQPVFYRLDRIKEFRIIEHVNVDRCIDVAERRKKLQKMYAGKECLVKFKCNQIIVEKTIAIFPDAVVVGEYDSGVIMEAKVLDKSFIRWTVGRLDAIEVLEPQNIRQMIKEKITALYKKYK